MENNSLQHHGILGQKWGKRNGPPYPLDSDNHSTSEKKAGWRKSLDSNDKQKKEKEALHLSEKQKRAIKIGAAVAATALATYGMYKLNESGALDKYIEIGKNRIDGLLGDKAGSADFGQQKVTPLFDQIDTATKTAADGLKRLGTPESLADSLAKANPLRGDNSGKNNCTLCSIAGFLRQSGYDVVVGDTGGKQQILGGVIEDCFKGARVIDGSAVKFGKSPEDAAEMLVKKFGENASGVCAIQWKKDGPFKGGHAFNWSIKDGKVTFADFQANRGHDIVKNYWKIIDPNESLTIARLDNADLIPDAIGKYVNNR